MINKRISQINELIKKEVGKILLHELGEHKGFITISTVDTTNDLRQATIWYLLIGGDEKAIEALFASKEREIQRTLNSRLSLRHVPRIKFRYDRSGEYANEINKLIEKTHEDEDKS